jgi:hypothetical protein
MYRLYAFLRDSHTFKTHYMYILLYVYISCMGQCGCMSVAKILSFSFGGNLRILSVEEIKGTAKS